MRRCPIIGADAKQVPVLILDLFKIIALLGAVCLLVVPAMNPYRDGRDDRDRPDMPDTRFSSAMRRETPIPRSPLPRLRFSGAGDFSEGMAPVEKDGRYGFIDTSGSFRIAPLFEFAGGFSGNRAPALIGGAWGYLDVTGAMAIPAVYDWAGSFRQGLAPVSAEGQYLFIDTGGTPVGPMRFSDARPYSEGYAAVRFGDADYGAWGFVDRSGSLAIPPLFDDVPGGFSEGLAVVKMERERPFRSGYIDSSGGFAIDTLYDAAGDFHEGRAPVGRGEWRGNRFKGMWGYVDTTGRPVTALTYAEAGPFQDGKALVRFPNGGGYALIDDGGRILKAFRADAEVRRGTGSDMVTYKLHKLFGFLDLESGRTIGPAFSGAGEMREGRARISLPGLRGGDWAYIDRNGAFMGGTADASAR